MPKLIEANLAAKRIAVNAEQARGARLIAVGTVQHTLDEFFLEFVDGLVKVNPALDHHPDQRFQLVLHRSTLRT